MGQLDKKNKMIKIVLALFVLAFIILMIYKRINYDVRIKDYLKLSKDNYLVVFYYDYFLSSSEYNATIVNFVNTQWFYRSYDQGNVYFTIGNYERIEFKEDSLIFYTNDTPNIRIQEMPYIKLEFKKP